MVLGDPYKFAVCFQTIPEWNEDNIYRNGVLMFFIDGKIFPPREVVNATLSGEINSLRRALCEIIEDGRIYTLNKDRAFSEMYENSFQKLEPFARHFDIQPMIFGDCECIVFAVKNGDNVRILASQLKYLKEQAHHNLQNITITEAFVSNDDLLNIIFGLKSWEEEKLREY